MVRKAGQEEGSHSMYKALDLSFGITILIITIIIKIVAILVAGILFGRLRQEDYKLETKLGHILRPVFKTEIN